MLKGIKIRLYPDEMQTIAINKLLGSCRFVYNHCLDIKIKAYELDKTSLSTTDLNRKVIELKNTEDHCWLKESNSKVIQQTLMNLDTAYKNFFRGIRNGTDVGKPKFKSKHKGDSCRFPVDAISSLRGNRLNLTTKIYNVLFKCSVKDEKYLNKNQGLIKSATLSKTKSGHYHISILIDKPTALDKFAKTDKGVGLSINSYLD